MAILGDISVISAIKISAMNATVDAAIVRNCYAKDIAGFALTAKLGPVTNVRNVTSQKKSNPTVKAFTATCV
jgi:hypothetical protein